jgi:hypothetical protein
LALCAVACGSSHITLADGGHLDGGMTDAGPDGGDAGAPDSGSADAGNDDGGALDSGLTDAGDGGGIDAGLDGGDAGLDAGPNPIAAENALPGDPTWQIPPSLIAASTFAYASPQAIRAGESIAIRVSTANSPVTLEVFRMGWYAGAGGRKIASSGSTLAAVETCDTDLTTGRVECNWPDTFALDATSSFLTGFYLAKVTDSAGFSTYAPFVVRESSRTAPILVKIPLATYQAYNQFGGASLYRAYDPVYSDGGFLYDRAVKVSFDRPYDRGAGAGDFFIWDGAAVRFLERWGYDVGYASSIDLESGQGLLSGRALYVSIGHDEYWSKRERDAVQTAVLGSGLNYAVLAGNVGYWHVRYEPSSHGQTDRTLVCYRYIQEPAAEFQPNDPTFDPDGGDNSDVTVRWRDYPVLRPENQISAEMYVAVQPVLSRQFVIDPGSWVFAQTGLGAGDPLPNSLGWETDVPTPTVDPFCSACAPSPAGSLPLTTGSFIADAYYDVVPSQMQLYQASPDAGVVFEAESYAWVWGLGDTPVASPAQQRITANVLDRLGVPASTPGILLDPPPPSDAGVTFAACDGGGWSSTIVLELDGGFAPVAIDCDDGGLVAADPDNEVVWTSSLQSGSATAIATPYPILGITHGNGAFYLLGHQSVAILTLGSAPMASDLDYINAALFAGSVQSAAIAFSGDGGVNRLFVLGQKGQLVAVDLVNQTAGAVDIEGLGSALAVAAQADGTLLILDGYERPGRIVKVDPSTIVDVTAPPASLSSTVLLDTTQAGGSPVSFGFLESGELEAMALAQLPGGATFASRTGLGDIALLGLGATPSICPVAGSGRGGSSWGSVSDIALPAGLAAGPNGTLLVADPINRRVLQLSPP